MILALSKNRIFIFLLILFIKTNSQVIINPSSKVIEILSSTLIRVSDPTIFNVGDTVLIIQMKGASFYNLNNSNFGSITNIGGAGYFEFNKINSITNNYIYLTCPLVNIYTESVQLVKVKTFTNLNVNNELTSLPWDGNKGGVFVSLITNTLNLNANINVTGKGFRGIQETSYVNGYCSNNNPQNYWYTINATDSAGLKGEGIAKFSNFYARGKGKIANGGGGGNGERSGGGGGGNGGMGGSGGRESSACVNVGNHGGIGGIALSNYITTNPVKRIFLGGSGGESSFYSAFYSTQTGGAGGGIVILLANKIYGNYKIITSNGVSLVESGTLTNNAAGGGAGGSIILWRKSELSPLYLHAIGGKGGDASTVPCTGSGGGGGGGIIFYNSPYDTNVIVAGGVAGSACSGYSGTNGGNGVIIKNFFVNLGCLKVPNTISSNVTVVCKNQSPPTFTGTQSNLICEYQWEISYDSLTWLPAPGVNNQPFYSALPLAQTSFFRRKVLYLGGESEVSNVIKIKVSEIDISVTSIPNYCSSSCTGIATVEIQNGIPVSFQWSSGEITQTINHKCPGFYYVTVTNNDGCTATGFAQITHSSNEMQVNLQIIPPSCDYSCDGTININAVNGLPPYQYSTGTSVVNNVCDGQFYVSVSDANGCVCDTTVFINSLMNITNNIISVNNTVFCKPQLISFSGSLPQGVNDYSYLWQIKIGEEWLNAPGIYNGQNYVYYNPQYSFYIRRIVIGYYQGITCYDTSNVLYIIVSSIEANAQIQKPTCDYSCNGTIQINVINGIPPFYYTSGSSQISNICPGFFNVIVTDSINCSDTLFEYINPLINITNNFINTTDSVLCAYEVAYFTGTIPSGAGTFNFKWQINYGNNWTDAPGVNYNQNYILTNPSNSFYIRRIVKGQFQGQYCYDTSNVIYVNIINLHSQIYYQQDTVLCSYSEPDTIFNLYQNSQCTYLWQVNINNTWENVDNYTSFYFIYDNYPDTFKVRCIINFNGCTDTSNVITFYKTKNIENNISINGSTFYQYCGIANGIIEGNYENTYSPYYFEWLYSNDSVNWSSLMNYSDIHNFSITESPVKYHFIRILNYYACKDTSNVVTIENLQPIVANMITTNQGSGPIVYICEGSSVGLGSFNINPAGGTGTYYYQWIISYDSLTWNIAPGISTNSVYVVLGLFDTLFLGRIVYSGACVDTSNIIKLIPITLPENIISANDTLFCNNDSIVYLFEVVSTQNENVSYIWQYYENNTWYDLPNSHSPHYSLTPTQNMKIRRIIYKQNCQRISNEINIYYYSSPSINIILQTDTVLCSNNSNYASFLLKPIGNPPYNLEFSFNSNNYTLLFTEDTIVTLILDTGINVISFIKIYDNSPCLPNFINSKYNIKLYMFEEAYCIHKDTCGLKTIVEGNLPQYGTGQWLGSSSLVFSNPFSNITEVTTQNYGQFQVVWQILNGPCIDTCISVINFYQEPEQPSLDVYDNTFLDENITYSITIPIPVGNGYWSVIEGDAVVTPDTGNSVVITNFSEGKNIIKVVVENGTCPKKSDSITIYYYPIFIPEGFSPNNDGTNDYFEIKGLDPNSKYKIIIFNRWGNVVYTSENYNNKWDGKNMDNNDLPEDTYFYLLKKNNKPYKSGFVVIKR
ncbi:MAG: gliding motility-associated C-terminal domain-containing protein [Bacteroidales bacterium]|nr:gliding motility-associated C-terminal domain-containing protein [Bacteroidales bacterium]